MTEAGSLISLDRGTAWLLQSPTGYFDGSTGIEAQLRWRVAGQVVDDADIAKRYHRRQHRV